MQDESEKLIDLDLLDRNPFDSRQEPVDQAAVDELAAGIHSTRLINAILVRPTKEGRFQVAAGWRRTLAFRQNRATHGPERYAKIRAVIALGITDIEMAVLSYQENVTRKAISAVDEARHIDRILEEGLARTPEELAPLLGQKVDRVKRLRRFSKAPPCIKEAVGQGVMVATGTDEAAKQRRCLDLMGALEIKRLYDQLAANPRLAPIYVVERTTALIHRALAKNWGVRDIKANVDRLIANSDDDVPPGNADELGGDDAELSTGTAADVPAPKSRPSGALFELTSKRFVVDLARVGQASEAQLTDILAALQKALSERRKAPRNVAPVDGVVTAG